MSCTLSFAGKLFYIVEALRQAEIRLKSKRVLGLTVVEVNWSATL